jgi:cytochrome c oxidase cbb3-type subunit 4
MYELMTQLAAGGGLFYFASIFAVVLVYALRPSARRKFDEAARIPLRKD